ncbi:MAG: ATP-binding cassette domain-containing protein [Lachnospiraceae bacterium]|nr:ATP-binding cassette domain-containing protein [Lachnospiraceae bacterium]
MIVYQLISLSKEFREKGNTVEAVKNVNLNIEKGKIYGIIGFSGAGKSTLVRCLNLLEVPTSGKVIFNGKNLLNISPAELRKCRQKIGMIFQSFNLLSQRNVVDNVCYPLEIAGVKRKEAKQKALELLEMVGLKEKAKSYPSQLSGGQKQRVAIARALATSPDVLLCDEATSALDPITTTSILELLKEINQKLGVTIIIITHEMKVVELICDHVAVMSEGTVVEQGEVKEIFVNPKAEITKKLVLNKALDASDTGRNFLRIVFEGQSAFEPILSSLVLECNTMVNILGANTENIGGKAYGQMLIELPKDSSVVNKIKKFLDSKSVYYEEGGIAG